MKRVASPRGWPKKVFSEPEIPGDTESFVRLDAMSILAGRDALLGGPRAHGEPRTRGNYAPMGGGRHRRGPASVPTPTGSPLRIAGTGGRRPPGSTPGTRQRVRA